MSNRNILQALQSAGGAGGATLDVDEVFSTYLYTGNSSNQTITNNIDLSGEGGLVWIKNRGSTADHALFDSTTSFNSFLVANSSTALATISGSVSPNTNGFSLSGGYSVNNNNANTYVSWTFRKAPKFFDVVTYTGNGASGGRTISHNLGTTVGLTVVKCTSHTQNLHVLHRSANAAKVMFLNSTQGESNDTYAWNSTHATSTHFTVGAGLNTSGREYVVYLFAHNNNDGEFGPDSDQDIIKCGTYTTNSSYVGSVNLGWEPQFLLIKTISQASDWYLIDSLRGATYSGGFDYLVTNRNDAAQQYSNSLRITSTGFEDLGAFHANATISYMAIRRGPLAIPEDATKVFNIETRGATAPNPPAFNADFDPDFGVRGVPTDTYSLDRLTAGSYLRLSSNGAKTNSSTYTFDFSRGFFNNSSVSTSDYGYMWRRAPSYFDVLAYEGSGSNVTLTHNLGVAPEMIWFKKRSGVENWVVYHKDLTGGSYPSGKNYLFLNDNNAVETSHQPLTSAPTSSGLPLSASSGTNQSGQDFIAYLFATAPGVSKVGSYTGNGSSQNIDCGFSNGSRLIIIKNIDNPRSWHLFDTARGISTGNVTSHQINDSSGLTADCIDPLSSGFTVNSAANMTNINNIKYIFYAIA